MILQKLRYLGFGALRFGGAVFVGGVTYLWVGLSTRALIRFDRTGLEPGEPGSGLPVDHTATPWFCISPVGGIAALGGCALALLIAIVLRRWPSPVRTPVAAAPAAQASQRGSHRAREPRLRDEKLERPGHRLDSTQPSVCTRLLAQVA